MHFSKLKNSLPCHLFEISVLIFLDHSSICTVMDAGQYMMLDGICIGMLISYYHYTSLYKCTDLI
jgi:hypothetical protein